MKRIKYKKQLVILSIVIILCLVSIIIFKPYYKSKDRVKKIKNFNESKENIKPLGWLRVQGTNIDFPIMYYYDVEDVGDPTYDLGWSFDNNRKLANRTVILSHNMRNVSSKPLIGDKEHARFEQLMGYIYYDFVKENKYIQYTIDGKNYLFKIYGVSLQKEKDVDLENLDKDELEDYIKYTKKQSYFKFDVNVNKNDKLITLITCTRFFGNSDYSFVVDARKVRKNELIKNYKVTEKDNYRKIKKILEGDDEDE